MIKKRWVGIDFGLRRIGVAISDPLGSFALPIGKVESGKTDQETLQKIQDLLTTSGIKDLEGIVVGLPIHLDGNESEMSARVKLFAKVAEDQFGIQVILLDERLTSKVADNLLKSREMNRKRRKDVKDTLSAAIILQNHLDQISMGIF